MSAAADDARLPSRHVLAVTALLAAVALVFVNALGVAFVLDDLGDIADNPSAAAATFFDRLPFTNRPLTKASYALNDAAHGLAPMGYAAVNLTLHAIAAVLAFLLVRRAFETERAPGPVVLALAVCLIWALHPALTESVTYLSGRSMALSAVLMLGALLAATGGRPRPALAAMLAFLAPLARETALILPLLLLWWGLTIGHPAKRAWPVWLGALLAALVIAAMPRHRDLIAYSLDMRDPVTALRDNLLAAAETLGFWVQPWRVTIMPDAPPPYGWIETPTLAALAGFAAAALIAIALRRRTPVFAFGIGFALLALAPAQSFIWRVDPVALKPLYLAGLGLTLAAASLAARALPPRAVLVLALLIAVPLGVMTRERNALFARETALYADAVAKTPDNPDALIAYGSALIGEERYDEAYDVLTRAADRAPDDERAMNLLALVATIRGVAPASDAP